MEKLDDMELEDWEILSDDDGFLDYEKGMLVPTRLDFNPKGVFDAYFKYPLPDSPRVGLDDNNFDEEVVKEVIKVPILDISKELLLRKNSLGLLGGDQEDVISQQHQQVFFNKMKGNQFVDIKMDSAESAISPKEGIAKDDSSVKELKEEIKWEEKSGGGGGGLSIWKWRITGIGAICSIGMAAASIFIFILGSQNRNQQSQKLQFQIYTDDKKFKQVIQQATKLNQTISSVRGGPFNSAHFTYGGYYVCDGGA